MKKIQNDIKFEYLKYTCYVASWLVEIKSLTRIEIEEEKNNLPGVWLNESNRFYIHLFK